ncbi:MAG: glutamine synthetase beta-grasp domain-containing protein [Candidatus Thermoplasmatota archaeon]|nr:glutamine synthetase beta-grasp domain-containing protein [Candidatus Thermoplasmatota archaeon]
MKKEGQPEAAMKMLREKKVKWLHIHFTDLVGRLRAVSFPAKDWMNEDKWHKPITFDASSCGMATVNASDMLLRPEPSTLLVYPWTSGSEKMARVMATIIKRNGETSSLDSRGVALRTDQRIKEMGFDGVELGPEMEFYLFRNMREATIESDLWHGGIKKGIGTNMMLPDMLEEYGRPEYPPRATSAYFLADSKDMTLPYRNELCDWLMDIGVGVKYHHHEGGSRQVEVEFESFKSAAEAGDGIGLLKHVSRIVARGYDILPTFMPKPLTGDAGSGMHLHVHLSKKGKSVFLDEKTEKLSQNGRYFVGGVLDRAREMALVTNPIVNSYRRLVPGFEAPRYLVWAYSNRSSLVRIPPAKGGKMDVEVRNGDAAANPYLLPALIMEAGMEGIKKKMEPGDCTEDDVDHLSRLEIKKRRIGELPYNLGQAIDEAENSEFLKRIMGKEALESLVEYKRKEWQGYLGYCTPWEIFHYFDV